MCSPTPQLPVSKPAVSTQRTIKFVFNGFDEIRHGRVSHTTRLMEDRKDKDCVIYIDDLTVSGFRKAGPAEECLVPW